MAAPQLRIPVRANLDDFNAKMKETGTAARAATKQILNEFVKMNQELAGPIAATMAANAGRSILGLVGKFALVVGAAKLVGDTISAVSEQIESMVEIADKATGTGLSPEFWQNFMAGAKGAEKQIAMFETALANAYQALKPVLAPDWSVWDEGVQKVTAIETAMREMRELFSTDQNSSGLDLFRNAKDQDQRISAVLTYMKQLQDIGQNLAAMDLGEKMFGRQFADQIRQGNLSVNQMLDDIKTKSATAFSDDLVRRAKELDTELKNAWHTIDQNLHPSMETLDSVGLSIKSVWVEIVKLMEKASGLLNPTITGSNNLVTQLAATGESGFQTPEAIEAAGKIDAATALPPINVESPAARVPLPRRRPDVPKPETYGGSERDRLTTGAEAIEKRTAALRAETDTIGLNTAARERARIAAQLTATAMQMNADAGKGENLVTAEQKRRIEQVAEAYEKAAAALEKVRVNSENRFQRNTAFLSSEDVAIAQQLRGLYGDDVPRALASTEAAAMRTNNAFHAISQSIESSMTSGLADIVSGTVSVKQGFASMTNSILQDLERVLIKTLVIGPVMKALGGGMFGGGSFGIGPMPDGSVVPSAMGNVFSRGALIPFARGGVIDRATVTPMALMGEAGPEAVMPLRRGADGKLGVAAAAGGGNGVGNSIQVGDINITVTGTGGGSPEELARAAPQIRQTVMDAVDERVRFHSRPRGMLNRPF